jgi:hypothetical protein
VTEAVTDVLKAYRAGAVTRHDDLDRIEQNGFSGAVLTEENGVAAPSHGGSAPARDTGTEIFDLPAPP